MEKQIRKYSFILFAPVFAAFLLVFIIPFILGIYLSFTEFTTVSDAVFVGLKNYAEVFKNSGDFLNSLWFTVKFAVVSVISINVFAFLIALALTRNIRGRNLYRTVFFMPNLIGGIVLGYIWQLIINGILYNYGYSILSNANFGFWGLIVLMNWQMIGYMMIIYIAGLQNVPPEQIEAARVDGAGNLRILFKITIPAVMPSITICLFLTLTNAFKLFDQNLALTAGAPARKTEMLALNIYNTFYGRAGAEGIGQAKAVIFSLLVAAIALLQLYLTRRKEYEN
ncbi:MAG: sugar ABC transporter permease [Acutalibacteraceae bacterium]|nr:sugar ABC transporter permease [Acutalibacteraceae bacterium]